MELRSLGRTGIRVSELCLGCMTFGREADEATSKQMVDRFVDAGGNFIDTADVYSQGVSEEITGRAIKAKRDQIVLATKVRFPMGDGPNDVGASRRHIRLGVEASLRRLGTDWIDLSRSTASTAARRSRRRSPRSTTSCTRARCCTSARATTPRGSS